VGVAKPKNPVRLAEYGGVWPNEWPNERRLTEGGETTCRVSDDCDLGHLKAGHGSPDGHRRARLVSRRRGRFVSQLGWVPHGPFGPRRIIARRRSSTIALRR